jgi:predicted HTH transcriptional regulator
MDIGLSVKECDPWATYVDTRTRRRLGQKGTEGLTELERRVYEFVRSKGRVTRAEVMAELGLTATELETQLLPLVHSDMLKERSQGDIMYLIPID